MKIIKEGNFIPKSYILTCDKCSCIFEVEEDEYELEFNRNEHYIKVKCPWCENNICKQI